MQNRELLDRKRTPLGFAHAGDDTKCNKYGSRDHPILEMHAKDFEFSDKHIQGGFPRLCAEDKARQLENILFLNFLG
jgi:hypothetical protein